MAKMKYFKRMRSQWLTDLVGDASTKRFHKQEYFKTIYMLKSKRNGKNDFTYGQAGFYAWTLKDAFI
jgi:hypothetical protein